jgi:transcriptional regulator with XRE-family HTH domain
MTTRRNIPPDHESRGPLGRLLLGARRARGLRLRHLEEATGLTTQFLSHVEKGRSRDVKLSSLVALARGYGLPIAALLEATGIEGAPSEAAPASKLRALAHGLRERAAELERIAAELEGESP